MVKYFNLKKLSADGNNFDQTGDNFSVEVNYPTDGSADVPFDGTETSLRQHIDRSLRLEGYLPEEEFAIAASRDTSLVYRTYNLMNKGAQREQAVRAMLSARKIKRFDLKVVGWDRSWGIPDSMAIGLPTEVYHRVLATQLESIGYIQAVPIDVSPDV